MRAALTIFAIWAAGLGGIVLIFLQVLPFSGAA